jgi:hypothetical protein
MSYTLIQRLWRSSLQATLQQLRLNTVHCAVAPRRLCPTHSHVRSFSSASSVTSDELLDRAKQLLANCRNVVAITGAGISTESGIPDYRSPGRPPHRPTSHQQFMASHLTRQRYWARSLRGFEALAESKPNGGHVALAYSEQNGGPVRHIITQNVDNCQSIHALGGKCTAPLA